MPHRLRYRLAWDHGLSRAVLLVYARVLLDVYVTLTWTKEGATASGCRSCLPILILRRGMREVGLDSAGSTTPPRWRIIEAANTRLARGKVGSPAAAPIRAVTVSRDSLPGSSRRTLRRRERR